MVQIVYLICEQEKVGKDFSYHIILASMDKDVVTKKLAELLKYPNSERKYTFSSVYLEQGTYSYIGSNSYEDCEEEEN
jgi:hypothetical protein